MLFYNNANYTFLKQFMEYILKSINALRKCVPLVDVTASQCISQRLFVRVSCNAGILSHKKILAAPGFIQFSLNLICS